MFGPSPANMMAGLPMFDMALAALDQERKRQYEEQAAAAVAAQQAAGQAQTAYTDAASAPPAQLDPRQQFTETLTGNLASVIGGTPDYRQNAQKRLGDARASMLDARAQNLAALQRVAEQKARAAEQAGNLAEAQKERMGIEKRALILQQLRDQTDFSQQTEMEKLRQSGARDLENLRSQNDMRLEGVRQKGMNDRANAGLNPDGTPDAEVESWVEAVVSGQTELDKVVGRNGKLRSAVNNVIQQRGLTITPKKARDSMLAASQARAAVDEMEKLWESLNTSEKAGVERFLRGGALNLEAFTQSNPNAAAFIGARKMSLALVNRVAGERGPQTDRDIQRAEKALPGLSTTREAGRKQFQVFRSLVDKIEQDAINAYTKPNAGRGSAKVFMLDKKGERWEVDAADVPDAIKRGWKRTK